MSELLRYLFDAACRGIFGSPIPTDMTIHKPALLLLFTLATSSLCAQRGDERGHSILQERIDRQRAMVAAELGLDEAQQAAFITQSKINDEHMRESYRDLARILERADEAHAKGWVELSSILTQQQVRMLNHLREQGMLELLGCPAAPAAGQQPCALHSSATPGCCAGPNGARIDPTMKAPSLKKKGEEPPRSKNILETR